MIRDVWDENRGRIVDDGSFRPGTDWQPAPKVPVDIEIPKAFLKAPSSLEDAARAYVAARIANDAAEPCDWTARAAEVDRTWHEMLEAFNEVQPQRLGLT